MRDQCGARRRAPKRLDEVVLKRLEAVLERL
jgi:hypothetical protein